MSQKRFKLFGVPALVMLVGLASGCASTEEIQAIRSMAEEAKAAADSAASAARDAQSTANSAARDAAEAKRMASDAQACCNQNSEKLDRMFKKSMQK